MKRILLILVIAQLSLVAAVAQPPARQRQQQQQQQQEAATKQIAVSERAQMDYPTAPTMPDDVAWRRDLYRKIDLTAEQNAVLYYPQEPTADRMNLFTYLFKLVMRRQITAYDYTIDGNENLVSSNVAKPQDILDRHHIRYESKDGKFRIEDSDIPSADVKAYYVKESTYFDQHTSQFRTQITAICPIRTELDEFGAGETAYPMFWLKYDDIAPYLAKLELMASGYNNAATITADDYFATNRYDGTIYKTSNLQGIVLANYCQTDTALQAEQDRIEQELVTLENHVWGTDEQIDSLATDSLAADSLQTTKATKKSKKKTDTDTSSRTQVKQEKESGSSSSSSSSSSPRLSVRRQRH